MQNHWQLVAVVRKLRGTIVTIILPPRVLFYCREIYFTAASFILLPRDLFYCREFYFTAASFILLPRVLLYRREFLFCRREFYFHHREFLPEASFGLRVLSSPASVCVSVCVCQSLACPRDNLRPVQARIAKFGPKMQKTLVKVPIVLGGNWPWPSRSNLT